MARTTDVNVTSERNPRKREPDDRAQPFLSVLLMALFGPPALVVVLRFFLFFSADLLTLMVWLVLFVFGVLAPLTAVGVGYKVSKRIPFVVWHVAGTVEAFAVAVSIGIGLGWHRAGPHWWDRIADVVTVPAPAAVIYLICTLGIGLSWMLYRIDAFRAATGADGDAGNLAKLLGMPVGVSVRSGSITTDDYAVTATIDHPTVPADKVAAVLPALVENAGAVRGRSTIIANERGGSSTVRIVKSDPMKDWRIWPGLSHAGLSFAYPFRTAYYSTGPSQWYSFAKTPERNELPPSPIVPDFRSENDAHMGRQGATRSGKSGDINIEIAEALSRRDDILCLVNTAKLMQDAGWCLDMAGLAADTPQRAKLLFAGLRSLGEYRSHIMGDPRREGRHRTWTPATYEELGFAAILLEVDEGDTVLQASDATWLATKGLSLGIYASISISRAVTDGMASTLRSAIPTWKAFGAGVDYDAGFALSDETLRSGADPAAFGTRFPGAHYLDKAQGVAETLYPVDARSFKGRKDNKDLRAAVEAARATFTPATFTPGEINALKDAWTALQPRTLLLGAFDLADRIEYSGGNETASDQEGNDMTQTLNLDRFESGDPELDDLMNSPPENFDEYEREYGPLPPANEPLPLQSDPDSESELESTKPRVSPEQSVAEFDAALVRMAARGVREFGNKDVIDEMRVAVDASRVSRRFTAICDDGATVRRNPPPGLAIERVPGKVGRFIFVNVGA